MNNRGKKVLDSMFEELEKSPSIYQPSKFWSLLNKVHMIYLSNGGFKDFKRSINTRYFDWGALGIAVHQLAPILNEILEGNFALLLKSKFLNYNLNLNGTKDVRQFNYITAFIYKIYVASLFEYIIKNDELKILDKIEEPLIGNPFVINYKGKLISQDLCNSVYDFISIFRDISLPKKAKIAELGAGYGRVGYVILKMMPDSIYCVIDIPPALFIAQNYLSKVFSKEKIFKFRPFESFKDVRKEFEQSHIQFLMPHQIKLLPKKYFDLLINISSLHEMTRKQIKHYLEQIDRLGKGYFYTKQWRKSRVRDNQNISESEYPIPKNWKIINKRDRHPIQRMFFDTLYRIK